MVNGRRTGPPQPDVIEIDLSVSQRGGEAVNGCRTRPLGQFVGEVSNMVGRKTHHFEQTAAKEHGWVEVPGIAGNYPGRECFQVREIDLVTIISLLPPIDLPSLGELMWRETAKRASDRYRILSKIQAQSYLFKVRMPLISTKVA